MYWNMDDKERLVTALTLADSQDLMERFLEDLLTEEEIKTCIQRLRVMFLIQDGAPYKTISSMTGLAPATIARLVKKSNNIDGGFYEIREKFLKKGPAYSE